MKYINFTIAIFLAIATVICAFFGLFALLQYGAPDVNRRALPIFAVSIVLFLLTVNRFYKYWTSK